MMTIASPDRPDTQAALEVLVVDPAAPVPARASGALPSEVLAEIEVNQAHSRAKNTIRAYESDWAAFERWCDSFDQVPLPATGETVAGFLSMQSKLISDKTGDYVYSPRTIARRVSAINAVHLREGHAAPGAYPEVKDTLAGIRRRYARPLRQMHPLLMRETRKVLENIDLQSWPQGVIGVRDSAIIVMGLSGAFRSSELASRAIGDVRRHSEDGLHVTILTSKTDQEGRGMVKALPFGDNPLTCPPCAFLRWIRVLAVDSTGERSLLMRHLREIDTAKHICQGTVPELRELISAEPLFRPVRKNGLIGNRGISGAVVYDVVKRRLERAGMDPENFGSHSLRSGFVTQSLRAGASHTEVMRQTGQKSVATVEIYRRDNDPLRQNAVTRLGL